MSTYNEHYERTKQHDLMIQLRDFFLGFIKTKAAARDLSDPLWADKEIHALTEVAQEQVAEARRQGGPALYPITGFDVARYDTFNSGHIDWASKLALHVAEHLVYGARELR